MFFIPLRHLFLFTEHAVHLIEGGIIGVKVLAVHLVLRDAQGIGETIKGEWILRYPLFYIFHLIFRLSFDASIRSIKASTTVILSLMVSSSQWFI